MSVAYTQVVSQQRSDYVCARSTPPSPVSFLALPPTASVVDEGNESTCTISLDLPIHSKKNSEIDVETSICFYALRYVFTFLSHHPASLKNLPTNRKRKRKKKKTWAQITVSMLFSPLHGSLLTQAPPRAETLVAAPGCQARPQTPPAASPPPLPPRPPS